MSRRGKSGKLHGQFVALEYRMLDSKAWRRLSPRAVWAYVEIMHKAKMWADQNIKCPYRALQRKLKSSATVRKSLKELLDGGFLHVTQQDGLFRNANRYGVSKRWMLEDMKPIKPPPGMARSINSIQIPSLRHEGGQSGTATENEAGDGAKQVS